jgi:hypothetical protein
VEAGEEARTLAVAALRAEVARTHTKDLRMQRVLGPVKVLEPLKVLGPAKVPLKEKKISSHL